MITIVILSVLLVLALVMVSVINKTQERQRIRRSQRQRLRFRISNLEEMLACLEQTIPNRLIAKHINDEILDSLQKILSVESDNIERIETSLRDVEARGEELTGARDQGGTSYRKDSDVQIAQSRLYINEAGGVLRRRYSQGRITEEELDIYIGELAWAHLMVSVISLIGQGYKATVRGDSFSAHAYYQNAQHQLLESTHPEPKRMRMIRELSEIMTGSRELLSEDLVPSKRPL